MDLLQSSEAIFFEMCKDLRYVVPNLPAMVEPTPASALKLVTLDEWPDQIPLAKAGHFVVIHVDKFEGNFPLNKDAIGERYKQVTKAMDVLFAEMVRVKVLTCVRDIFNNLMILRGQTNNESEVRFAFGNPIVSLLCAVHGYFLSTEQKLETPAIGTTRRSSWASGEGVSEKSCADHICYTLHHQKEDSELKLAAVILEAKTNANFSHNSVAQLLGYYLRSCTKEDEHTVALVLTESRIHLLLFPFTKAGVSCTNAIWLQAIEYSENNIISIINMLYLLCVITQKEFYCKVNLEDRLYPISKDYQFTIKTEIELLKEKLEWKLKKVEEKSAEVEEKSAEVEEKTAQVEKDMKEIALQKNYVQAKLKAFDIVIKKLSPEDIASITGSLKDLELNN